MLPPLTIRNLTAIPLTLKTVVDFDVPPAAPATITSFLSQATGSFLPQIRKSRSKGQLDAAGTRSISSEAQASSNQAEKEILCESFRTRHTDINISGNSECKLRRLIFSAPHGHQYRFDVPAASTGTQMLASDKSGSDLQITGVFVVERSWLALYSSTKLCNWMQQLHDSTPLSALSIPGTHNSPTFYRALPSVRCQAVSPREQLENGVRFFDIRIHPESTSSSRLSLVHGVFPVSLSGAKTFGDDLLPFVYQFLQENPSETLIMSIKREGAGNALTDEDLSKILYEKYCNSPEGSQYWYTDPRVPTLGQARGRIVIMRRFNLHTEVKQAGKTQFGEHELIGEWAIDASHWADNTPYDLQRQICVQDFYEVLETQTIKKKLEYVCAQLARSGSVQCSLPGERAPLHLNFLTASNFFNPQCWPERIAAKMNPAITEYLALSHGRELDEGYDIDAGTGIIVTDWCGLNGDWDLIYSIVGYNARVWSKQNR